MSGFISTLKNRLQLNSPKYSDQFTEQKGFYPFYVPTKEWESSYDVSIYFLSMYKNKDTGEVEFDLPSFRDPVEETVFNKEQVESLSNITFSFHGDNVEAIPAHAIKPEKLPKIVRSTMKKGSNLNAEEKSAKASEIFKHRLVRKFP